MRYLLVYILFFSSYLVKAQPLKYLNFDGLNRRYLEYLPSTYNPQQKYALLISLHGLGDNIINYSSTGFHFIGDTAGFITLYPEGIYSPFFGNAWNCGLTYMGYTFNSNINDVGFILKLIDTTKALYNIDTNKIYVCGFSMGGFMSQRLACELSHKIAAVASVAGTIGNSLNCNPVNKIPVCHLHGTADSVVLYNNNSLGFDVDSLIRFWVNHNQCDTNYIFHQYFNSSNDFITVESFTYPQTNGADVTLYKAIGAGHVWLYQPLNDISYSFEIWKFFRNRSLLNSSYKYNYSKYLNNIFYPNPARNYLFMRPDINIIDKCKLLISNSTGQVVYSNFLDLFPLNINFLQPGMYNITLINDKQIYHQKLLVIP